MRSRELLRKELDELFAARAFRLLLIVIGLLVGQAFIEAVSSYAEMSSGGALAQGLSPLDGILVPTLGAYDLAIMLLFPFVAIRLVSAEKGSDAWKLMLQWPVTMRQHVASKVIALLVAWLVSLAAFAIALGLWVAYGGHVSLPELCALLCGYSLRFLLTAALAMAAAAVMPGAANAAVVVLAFTIGTWALDFIAAGRGGWMQRVAAFTPAAALRNFEHGLLRVDVILVMLTLSIGGFVIAGIWLHIGRSVATRAKQTSIAAFVIIIATILASMPRSSFDVSENRRNSFSRADERALARIHAPLSIRVYLSAEDPRMHDFEGVLVKLRRSANVHVDYPLEGRTALFEEDPRYGEMDYRLDGKTAVSRSTTEEIILDTIYGLAAVNPPAREESSYGGYPLKARPRGAAVIFYLVWPLAIVVVSRVK